MMGVFAEFERAMIRERVNAGLARFRAQGPRDPTKRKVLGRPRVTPDKEKAITRLLRAKTMGIRKIAGEVGVGVGTVQRIAREIGR
jgi:DNA invertase Pin-like site-specific DNA recombinase